MGSGVHTSLHVNCHHQIIYAKFKLQIYYPPPYERVDWHYKHAKRIISEKPCAASIGKGLLLTKT